MPTSNDRVEPELLGQITLASFSNEKGLEAAGSNLSPRPPHPARRRSQFPAKAALAACARVTLRTVRSTRCAVITELIKAQRGYELNAKVISAADQMLGATTQVR